MTMNSFLNERPTLQSCFSKHYLFLKSRPMNQNVTPEGPDTLGTWIASPMLNIQKIWNVNNISSNITKSTNKLTAYIHNYNTSNTLINCFNAMGLDIQISRSSFWMKFLTSWTALTVQTICVDSSFLPIPGGSTKTPRWRHRDATVAPPGHHGGATWNQGDITWLHTWSWPVDLTTEYTNI